MADPKEVSDFYNIELVNIEDLKDLDAVVIAVAHSEYIGFSPDKIHSMLKKEDKHIVIDVKSILNKDDYKNDIYWSL